MNKPELLLHFPYYNGDRNSMGAITADLARALQSHFTVTLCAIQADDLTPSSISVPPGIRTGVGRVDAAILCAQMKAYSMRRPTFVLNVSQEFIAPFDLRRSAVIVHDLIQLDRPRSRAISALMRWNISLCRRAALVISISQATSARLAARGVQAETIGLNSFDPTPFVELRRQPPRTEYAALWCGTLAAHKNLELFLNLCRSHPAERFAVIVPAQDRARTAVTAPANVVVLSDLPDDEYKKTIASAEIFISTSSHEGYGRPPMEAMLAGRPILISDIPIFREVYGELPVVFHDQTEASVRDGFRAVITAARGGNYNPPPVDILAERQGNLFAVVERIRSQFANLSRAA